MRRTDPTPRDFTDDIVARLTSYSLRVSVEDHEKVLRSIYPDHRLPGTDERRRSQMGVCRTEGCDDEPRSCGWCFTHCKAAHRHPRPHGACERCGEPLTWGLRFCSQQCAAEAQRSEPPTREELIAEMQAALDRLREWGPE